VIILRMCSENALFVILRWWVWAGQVESKEEEADPDPDIPPQDGIVG